MRFKMKISLLLALLTCLLAVGVVWAQTTTTYDLSWHVLAGGGRDMASPDHALRGTLGQFAIGISDGDDYTASSGYWYSAAPQGEGNWLFIPVVVKDYSR